MACASCHGERGQGRVFSDEKGGKPAGAINVPAFLTLYSDQALRRFVITGRPDLGMPDCTDRQGRPDEFKPLTSQEVTDLVALLASWREVQGPTEGVIESCRTNQALNRRRRHQRPRAGAVF